MLRSGDNCASSHTKCDTAAIKPTQYFRLVHTHQKPVRNNERNPISGCGKAQTHQILSSQEPTYYPKSFSMTPNHIKLTTQKNPSGTETQANALISSFHVYDSNPVNNSRRTIHQPQNSWTLKFGTTAPPRTSILDSAQSLWIIAFHRLLLLLKINHMPKVPFSIHPNIMHKQEKGRETNGKQHFPTVCWSIKPDPRHQQWNHRETTISKECCTTQYQRPYSPSLSRQNTLPTE